MKMGVYSKAKAKSGPLRTKRVQTVLTSEQYELLLQIARKKRKPVSALVREALEAGCLKEELRTQRQHALKGLLSLKAPVADWEKMESEIVEGAMDG